tara:strand:+ start:1169 stop:1528 length:360 start_codon:yes stop_codon:yes gene_type:complete
MSSHKRKVGVFITNEDSLLLQTGKNPYKTLYNIPTWDMPTGSYPIECLRDKVVNSLGVIKYDVDYIGNYVSDQLYLYSYRIKNWKGRINGRNLVWVHKSVLQMHPSSLPFEQHTIDKIF